MAQFTVPDNDGSSFCLSIRKAYRHLENYVCETRQPQEALIPASHVHLIPTLVASFKSDGFGVEIERNEPWHMLRLHPPMKQADEAFLAEYWQDWNAEARRNYEAQQMIDGCDIAPRPLLPEVVVPAAPKSAERFWVLTAFLLLVAVTVWQATLATNEPVKLPTVKEVNTVSAPGYDHQTETLWGGK